MIRPNTLCFLVNAREWTGKVVVTKEFLKTGVRGNKYACWVIDAKWLKMLFKESQLYVAPNQLLPIAGIHDNQHRSTNRRSDIGNKSA
jgi:hypothetical protein